MFINTAGGRSRKVTVVIIAGQASLVETVDVGGHEVAPTVAAVLAAIREQAVIATPQDRFDGMEGVNSQVDVTADDTATVTEEVTVDERPSDAEFEAAWEELRREITRTAMSLGHTLTLYHDDSADPWSRLYSLGKDHQPAIVELYDHSAVGLGPATLNGHDVSGLGFDEIAELVVPVLLGGSLDDVLAERLANEQAESAFLQNIDKG